MFSDWVGKHIKVIFDDGELTYSARDGECLACSEHGLDFIQSRSKIRTFIPMQRIVRYQEMQVIEQPKP